LHFSLYLAHKNLIKRVGHLITKTLWKLPKGTFPFHLTLPLFSPVVHFLARDCSTECPGPQRISPSVVQSPHPRSCYPDPAVVFVRSFLTSLATQTTLSAPRSPSPLHRRRLRRRECEWRRPGRLEKTKSLAPILAVQSSSDGLDAWITFRVDRGTGAVDPRSSG
jgi:hypothetical protein